MISAKKRCVSAYFTDRLSKTVEDFSYLSLEKDTVCVLHPLLSPVSSFSRPFVLIGPETPLAIGGVLFI